MKNRKFYFLCGLPRAGNTLLTSLFNQNPDIACTPNAFTSIITDKISEVEETDEYRNAPNNKCLRDLLKTIYPSFYKSWKQKYIIERGVAGLPKNFEYLINYVDKNLKIIYLYRPVLEVLASFVVWCRENPKNFLGSESLNNMQICDKLMEPDGMIMRQLSCLGNLMVPCNNKHGLIVNYKDLICNTEKTLEGIYKYLNIPLFKHKYKNLKQININGVKYDDSVLGQNLHTIKTKKIEYREHNLKKILGKKILDKYADVQINIHGQ